MQPQPNPFLPSIDTIMVLTVVASIIGSLVWLGLLWVIVRGATLSALRPPQAFRGAGRASSELRISAELTNAS